jgi:Ran GTPase-activating protein (RanGAP) involved in mRNA processing and transport
MRIFSFTVLFISCFFCSWVLRAAHKEKREEISGKATSMVRARSEEELGAVQEERLEEGGGLSSAKRTPQSVGDFIRDLLGRSAVKKGLLSLSGLVPEGFFDHFSAFSETKQLVLTRMSLGSDKTMPFTNALRVFSELERLVIRQSTIGDGMFFFLGMQVPQLPALHALVLDRNETHAIGVKAFLIGMSEAKKLRRFSWRHMPLDAYKIPWATTVVLKSSGYKKHTHEVTINVGDVVKTGTHDYVHKTPLRFLFEDAFPRLKLKHLDLGGSIIVKNHKDRRELMDFFDTIPAMLSLKSLGLSETALDEFSMRALSRSLVHLQEEQFLHSGKKDVDTLEELDLEGVAHSKSALKDLEGGIKASRHLTELNLARNKVGSGASSLLMSILPDLRALKVLNLSGNGLFSGESSSMAHRAKRLGEALLVRRDTLRRLNLSGNGMEDSDLLQLRESLLDMNLETLDLRYNRLTDSSMSVLRELSKKRHPLKAVLVSGNKLTPEGLRKLTGLGITVDAKPLS